MTTMTTIGWLLVASLTVVAFLAHAPVPVAASPTTNTSFLICSFTGGWASPHAVAAYHTVQAANRAGTFGHVHFNVRFLRTTEPFMPTGGSQSIVKSWVVNGTDDCDAVTGPGSSTWAIAVSPVIDVPWVDSTASSTELSNKHRHPYFSRMIPTDDGATLLTMKAMMALGWRDLNVITVDFEYGRSQAAGILAAAHALNATVHVTAIVPDDNAHRTVNDLLLITERIIRDSPSRIVFVGGFFNAHEYAVLHERKVDEKLVFVFGEGACWYSTSTPDYSLLSGALCTSFSYDTFANSTFVKEFENRSLVEEKEKFAQAGLAYPTDEPLMRDFSLFSALNHDGAFLLMTALTRFATLYPTSSVHKNEAALKLLRSSSFHGGATGFVSLDAIGNRVSAAAVLYSTGAGNRSGHFVVGRSNVAVVSITAPQVFLLGGLKTVGRETKDVGLHPSVNSGSESKTSTLVIALVVAVVIIVVVLVTVVLGFVIFAVFFKRSSRNNDAAPKDSKQPFAIVFTDIQSSTTLWSMIPEKMSTALDLHHDTIRLLIAQHNGYEVKTIGDAFMVAFSDPLQSVRFALALQSRFVELPWDEAVAATYEQLLHETSPRSYGYPSVRRVPSLRSSRGTWPGLRVRVGIHYGCGSIIEDITTGGFDYYGTVVNTAARVESVGHGGQTLVTDDTYAAVRDELRAGTDAHVLELGSHDLRGLTEPVSLFQLHPCDLAPRFFPPLRLEKANLVQDATEGIDFHRSHHLSETPDTQAPDTHSSHTADHEDDIGTQCTKVLLSALSVKDRVKIVAMLGQRWHVPMQKRTVLEENPAMLERAVASVGSKCTWVVGLKRTMSTYCAIDEGNVGERASSDVFATPNGGDAALPQPGSSPHTANVMGPIDDRQSPKANAPMMLPNLHTSPSMPAEVSDRELPGREELPTLQEQPTQRHHQKKNRNRKSSPSANDDGLPVLQPCALEV